MSLSSPVHKYTVALHFLPRLA